MKLPIISGREVIRARSNAGYIVHDQKGSHVHLRHPTRPPLTIPNHNEIAVGTLKEIIRAARLTENEFVNLL